MKLSPDLREFIALCLSERVEVALDGLACFAIGREALIVNKRATGRPQDLADVERLTKGEDQT
jgi:hypothetical protein